MTPITLVDRLTATTAIQDTLWSAQDDAQLIGRCWRYGQRKRVRVYRPIIDQTPDVFLNTICFDKQIMHQAFIAAPLQIRALSH